MDLSDRHSGQQQHVLVLGAYGLLGAGIVDRLLAKEMQVTGFGRNEQTAHRAHPSLNWIIGDLRRYLEIEDWREVLENITTVVNCSGALQDGPDDHLEKVHHLAIAALAGACHEMEIKLIQISAVGASLDANTEFLASKARGDEAIKVSGARYTILRPGLVLANNSYGGTALLRMLAAFPMLQAVSYPDAKIQTTSLQDVSKAVELSIYGDVPNGFEGDLVEEKTHSLKDIVTATRRWLGFGRAKFEIQIYDSVATLLSRAADALSWFGWNSPLRSTGVQVLRDGVTGNPEPWKHLGLNQISPLEMTLQSMRATSEHRLSARMSLLFPLLITILALFWIFSGLFGFISIEKAAAVLEDQGWSTRLAITSVVFWSIVDFILGFAILFRKLARTACLGIIITSVIYLIASTIFVPSLWLDPLGPLVKIFPSMLLALVTYFALEKR